MGTKDIMTMQEVQEMKQQLEQVFSIVRLLDGEILEIQLVHLSSLPHME